MKRQFHLAAVLLFVFVLIPLAAQADYGTPMIQTYWHQLNGPYWIYKPLAISAEGGYIYTFGSDKASQSDIFVTTNSGQSWIPHDRSNQPPNCISASLANPLHAYYSSPNLNMYYTLNGADWNPYINPPPNTSFNICAASPHDPNTVLVGCENSGESATLEMNTDPTDPDVQWTSISGYTNYPVKDIAWHPDIADKYYIGLNGVEGDCFYVHTTTGFVNESPDASLHVSSIRAIAVASAGGVTHVLAIGYGSTNWKILWLSNENQAWSEISLPSRFNNSTNTIHDLTISGISGSPIFYLATDVGIFKYDSQQWTDFYNVPGDNNVFSVAYSSATSGVYAGTLHSFISIASDQTFQRIKDVMFLADLKGSTFLTATDPQYPATNYTLNTKTGAIFQVDMDFSHFTPYDDNPSVGIMEPTIVANISGSDGEYDGLAIASHENIVLASSKNSSGAGKLIRFDGHNWQDINGQPAFEALAISDGGIGFGGFGGTTNNIYNDEGGTWHSVGSCRTTKVNGLLSVPATNYDPAILVMAGKRIDPNDNILAISTDNGASWTRRELNIEGLTEVYKVVVENKRYPSEHTYFYICTNNGVYKNMDIGSTASPWIPKTNQLPQGNYIDILPGSDDYAITPVPPDGNIYRKEFVLYTIKSEPSQDRFFITADTARSWVEDSSFPQGSSPNISKLSGLNHNYGAYGSLQTGIIAATDKGLYYHPHNVINGTYTGDYPSEYQDYRTIFKWGPGLILVNGSLIIKPTNTTDQNNPFMHASLVINPGTDVKIIYGFNEGMINTKSSIGVNDELGATGNLDQQILFHSSMSTGGQAGDWGGFKVSAVLNIPCQAECFPGVGLVYCKVKDGDYGISSQNALSISLTHSEISNCRVYGITITNGAPTYGSDDIKFSVGVYTSNLFSNLQQDISIAGNAGSINNCDPPYPDQSGVPNIRWVWDEKHGRWVPSLPCPYTYYTDVNIWDSQITQSDEGINLTGFMMAWIHKNKLDFLTNYGLDITKYVVARIDSNNVINERSAYTYSGVYLQVPYAILLLGNNIQNGKKSGVEMVGRSWIQLVENNVHDNGFANLYIQDASPLVQNDPPHTGFPTNSLIGAENGCYIIRTDFTPNHYAAPVFFCCQVKKYQKSGFYIGTLNCNRPDRMPFFGDSQYEGYNSISEGLSPQSWNLLWVEILPALHIDAINNWWGSDNPNNFRISQYVNYNPWLHFDPYPLGLPKRDVEGVMLPEELEITSAYPNPFNPNVTFDFSVPVGANVSGQIFDILGRQVKILADGFYSAGTHSVVWDGKNENGKSVNSGIYFVKFTSDGLSAAKKVTFLK